MRPWMRKRKITSAQVRQLRAEREAGEFVRTLARRYGIAHSTCWMILKGFNYKDAEG